jgi:zinc transporter ZupT
MRRPWSSWTSVAISVLALCLAARGPAAWLIGWYFKGVIVADLGLASIAGGALVLAVLAAVPALIVTAIDRASTDRWLSFRVQWFWYSLGFAVMSVLVQILIGVFIPQLGQPVVVGS